jgi:hypothetical protein
MPHADLLADLVYDGDGRGYAAIRSPGNVQRLPYGFSREDYEQILHDVRSLVARELGWQPS